MAKAMRAGYHHGDLRNDLLRHSLELLREKGAEALSLRIVALDLGVSQPAPYHHFADKNALLAALAAEGFRRLAGGLRKTPLRAENVDGQLRDLARGYIRFATREPHLFRLMFGPGVAGKSDFPELVAAAEQSYETLRARVANLLEVAGRPLDPSVVTAAIWSLGHGYAYLLLDGQISPLVRESLGANPERFDRIADLLVAGIMSDSRATKKNLGGVGDE